MQMFSLLLVCLLAVPADNDVLTTDDLLKINERFVAVHEYSDNEILYAECYKQLRDVAGFVIVPSKVERVSGEDAELDGESVEK